jgi:hypothetical protein
MSGSQMTAQGNAAIGQGVAAGLQGIEKGMETRAEINSVVNSTKTLLKGFETLESIPEETKVQMRGYLAQLDSPDLSDRDRGAIAKQLGSYANVIVGEGFKKSFENDKSAKVAAQLASMQIKPTNEQYLQSFKDTLAGKTPAELPSGLDMSRLPELLANLSPAEFASVSNALTSQSLAQIKARPDPRVPAQVAKYNAEAALALARTKKAGESLGGYATEEEAFASRGPGANSTNTSTYFSGGRYYPRSLEANQEGSVTSVVVDGVQYPALVLNNQLVDPDTKLPIFESSDMFGAKNTKTISQAWRKSMGLKVEDPVIPGGSGTGGAAVERRVKENGVWVLKTK